MARMVTVGCRELYHYIAYPDSQAPMNVPRKTGNQG